MLRIDKQIKAWQLLIQRVNPNERRPIAERIEALLRAADEEAAALREDIKG